MYTVADATTRIKNAVLARRKTVTLEYAKITDRIAEVLVKSGFLASKKVVETDGKKTIVVTMAMAGRVPMFTDVRIVSKPALRVYEDKEKLQVRQKRALGEVIVSTSEGIVLAREAIKKQVGGEVLFEIW